MSEPRRTNRRLGALSRNFANAMQGRRTYDGFKANAMARHGLTSEEYASLAPRAARLAKNRLASSAAESKPRGHSRRRSLLAAALGGLALSSGLAHAPHDPVTDAVLHPYNHGMYRGRGAVEDPVGWYQSGWGYVPIRAYRELRSERSPPGVSPQPRSYANSRAGGATSPAPPAPDWNAPATLSSRNQDRKHRLKQGAKDEATHVDLLLAAQNNHRLHQHFLGYGSPRKGSVRYVTPEVPSYASKKTPLYRGIHVYLPEGDEATQIRALERTLRSSESYSSFSRNFYKANAFSGGGEGVILRITPARIARGTPLEWFKPHGGKEDEAETLLPPGTYEVLGKSTVDERTVWDVSFAPFKHFVNGTPASEFSPPPAVVMNRFSSA